MIHQILLLKRKAIIHRIAYWVLRTSKNLILFLSLISCSFISSHLVYLNAPPIYQLITLTWEVFITVSCSWSSFLKEGAWLAPTSLSEDLSNLQHPMVKLTYILISNKQRCRSFLANVTNEILLSFYRQCGVICLLVVSGF